MIKITSLWKALEIAERANARIYRTKNGFILTIDNRLVSAPLIHSFAISA